MSDTYQRILKLRAVRAFEDRQVSDEDLARVLEAARWTGSAKNRQDWAFIVVRDADQKELLASAGSFTTPIRNAPMAIVLIQESGGYEFDTGRLAQNIMLAADAIGLASCPITLHDDARAAEILGLPEGRRARYAIALGYPAPQAPPSGFGGRKPLEELIHLERY